MDLDEFFNYKNTLMKDLCCSDSVISLIVDNEGGESPKHSLAYSKIYPYEFIPETVDDAQTFICFDVDIASVINKTYYTPVLYVWVFTHKSKMHLPSGGVRADQLAVEINKILNGSRYYGLGELDLHSVGRFSPITDYQGRVLTYYALDFNRHTSKQPPSRRKNE